MSSIKKHARYIKNRRIKKENILDNNFKNQKQERINEIKFANRNRNFEKALVLLDEYLNDYPDDIYMLIFKSSIYGKVSMQDKQRDLILNVLSRDLDSRELSFARLTYARYLKYEKNYDEAYKIYVKLIKESNQLELVARGDITDLCIITKEYEKALEYLKIDNFNNQFLNNLRSKIYMHMEKDNKALRELDREYIDLGTYDLCENLDDYIINQDMNNIRGHIYFKQKKYDLAVPFLEKALTNKNRKEYYLSLIDLARIQIAIGHVDYAISLCEDALKNIEKDGRLKSSIKRVLSVAYKVNNNYKKALSVYDEDDLEFYDNVAKTSLYFSRGEFDKAEKELIINPPNELGMINIEEYMKATAIKYRLGKYEEAKKYVNILFEYEDRIKKYNFYYTARRLRLLIQLGLGEKIEDDEYAYTEQQIINYDKNKALNHIIDHHIINASFSSFNEDIDIEKVFDEVKDKMDDSVVIFNNSYDRYIIKYNNIGYYDDKVINQLEVITIPNTKNIITMYPTKNLPNIDLEEEAKKPKKEVKRLSQIEKFNLKYGIN